ncbi:MAG: MFS transporter [Ignavibacteriales bacterium]|nr:MFS transporter [Ignavibacteriales bacterium]
MLYKLLPTPHDHPKEQSAVLRKNLTVHLFDGSSYVLGMSFIAIPTIYPIFIKELGGGPLAVGSVHVLWTIGANIYAAFIAQRLKRTTFFKPQMVFWGFVHRFMLFVSGIIAALLVGAVPSSVSVPIFLLLIFLTALFGNMSGLPWFLVYTKTVPVGLRGRLMGLRQLIGSAAGALGGYLVGIIIQSIAFPFNFSVLFFCGFIFTMVSFYFLTQVEEQPTVLLETDIPFSKHIFGDAKRILKANRNYRNYLIADALILMTMSSVSFYSIFAVEKFSLHPSYAGTFSAIVMITNIFSNIVFGVVADYYGHKVNVISAAVAFGLAALCAIVSPNIFLYGFVFVFIAGAIQIHMISRMPFVAELSSERERPLYVGITNTLTAPAMLIGIIFGVLVKYVGYEFIFFAAALLAAGAAYVLLTHVADPRLQKSMP